MTIFNNTFKDNLSVEKTVAIHIRVNLNIPFMSSLVSSVNDLDSGGYLIKGNIFVGNAVCNF